MKQRCIQQLKLLCAFLLVFLLILPLIVHLSLPLQFQQFLVPRWMLQHQSFDFQVILDTLISAYSSGINILFQPQPKISSLHNRIAIFSYIFSYVPPYSVVYPTEGFYYLRSEKLDIDGNIRVADLDKGKLTFAAHTLDYQERYVYEINESDGLIVEMLSDEAYKVMFRGKTVRFKIPHDTSIPGFLSLLPDEEYVGRIHDESGIRFILIFNHNTSAFYDVLDEDSITDILEPVEDNNLLFGRRTNFVFYQDRDYNRKILVGVNLSNIEHNNYFDGPGDQVPYWLDLKEKLNTVYPNTLLDGGIDKHGIYLNETSWRRVAIMPFIRYEAFDELFVRYSLCMHKKTKSFLWTCLTREPWNTPQWRQEILEEVKAQEQTFK